MDYTSLTARVRNNPIMMGGCSNKTRLYILTAAALFVFFTFVAVLASFLGANTSHVQVETTQNREKKETRIRSYITNMRNKNFTADFDTICNADDTLCLERIVRDVYNKTVGNTEAAVGFVHSLKNTSQQALACLHLYEEMRVSQHLDKKEVVYIMKEINDIILNPEFIKLPATTKNKILIINMRLRSRHNIDPTMSFLMSKTENNYTININSVNTLINKTYANSRANFLSTLNVAKEFGYMGYEALISEMKLHSHTEGSGVLMLAASINDALNKTNIAKEDRTRLESLKAQLPDLVWLILEDNVCLYNSRWKNDMLVALHNEGAVNDSARNVSISRIGTLHGGGQWRFEANSQAERFRIRNVLYNGYLMTNPGIKRYYAKRNVFINSIPSDQHAADWYVEFSHRFGSSIKLVNFVHIGRLCAGANMANGVPSVFTWLPHPVEQRLSWLSDSEEIHIALPDEDEDGMHWIVKQC